MTGGPWEFPAGGTGRLPDSFLDRLFREEGPRLARYVRRSLRNDEDAQDLVQEAFVNLAVTRPLGMLAAPEIYLRTVARNLLNRRARLPEKREGVQFVAIDEAHHVPAPAEQGWMMDAEDLRRRYVDALRELPDRTRSVFLMQRLDGMTYNEIAERLGISMKGVAYHMSRALTHLDQKLNSNAD